MLLACGHRGFYTKVRRAMPDSYNLPDNVIKNKLGKHQYEVIKETGSHAYAFVLVTARRPREGIVAGTVKVQREV